MTKAKFIQMRCSDKLKAEITKAAGKRGVTEYLIGLHLSAVAIKVVNDKIMDSDAAVNRVVATQVAKEAKCAAAPKPEVVPTKAWNDDNRAPVGSLLKKR